MVTASIMLTNQLGRAAKRAQSPQFTTPGVCISANSSWSHQLTLATPTPSNPSTSTIYGVSPMPRTHSSTTIVRSSFLLHLYRVHSRLNLSLVPSLALTQANPFALLLSHSFVENRSCGDQENIPGVENLDSPKC